MIVIIDRFDVPNERVDSTIYHIPDFRELFGIIREDIINHRRRKTLALDVSAIGISHIFFVWTVSECLKCFSAPRRAHTTVLCTPELLLKYIGILYDDTILL